MQVVKTREKFRQDAVLFLEAAKETVGSTAANRFLQTLDREITSTFEDRLDTAFQAVVAELSSVAGWQPALLPLCPVCQVRCKPDGTSTLECGHLFCSGCVASIRESPPDEIFDDDEEPEYKCPVCRSFSVCATRIYM